VTGTPVRAGWKVLNDGSGPDERLARSWHAKRTMLRQTAFAVLLVGTAVSLTTTARRRLGYASTRNGGGRAHAHHCFLCDGRWSHQGRCPEGRARLCPWCLADSRADTEALPTRIVSTIQEIGPARRGRHAHHCPRCLTTWPHRHAGPCTAGDRAVLPDCPGCRRTHDADANRQEPG
jgi:hypothetical protein